MTPEEMAGRLDGCEYRAEVTAELRDLARENGLVIVYGASDDLIEFRGAIDDELGCYSALNNHPSTYLVDAYGLVQRDGDMTDEEIAEYVLRRAGASTITAHWDRLGYAWTYEIGIHHAAFDVLEDGERYCRGIVFRLDDAGVTP